MSAKWILALALVVALVAFASPFYLDEEWDGEDEGGAGDQEMAAEALPYLLQKRGRGMRYNRCVNPDTGHVCKCDKSRSRSFTTNWCKK